MAAGYPPSSNTLHLRKWGMACGGLARMGYFHMFFCVVFPPKYRSILYKIPHEGLKVG